MRIQDLHVLPKFRDGWSYLYVEHCRIDQEAKAIAIHDATGKVPVPCANLALLMLGPGVSITHAAVVVPTRVGVNRMPIRSCFRGREIPVYEA